MRLQSGQVLVFFALALPLVLLPIAAYAIDAAVTSAAYSHLLEVTAIAAEDAADQLDVTALRAGDTVVLNLPAARAAAQVDVAPLRLAHITDVLVAGDLVTVSTAEDISLPLGFVGRGVASLRAAVTARIAAGYASPSSRLPLPLSSF